MKKFLAVVLSLLMLVSATAAFAEEAVDITGTWYLTQVILNGIAYEAANLDVDMEMTLNADGTGSLLAGGTTVECAWKEDNGEYLLMEAASQIPNNVRIEEGNLILTHGQGTSDEVGYIFSRQKGIAAEFAEVTVAESAEAFNGEYALVAVAGDGYTMSTEAAMPDLENIGVSSTGINIQDSVVSFLGNENLTFTFADDGTLALDTNDGLELSNVKIFKLADGGIVANWLGLSFYAQPVTEEVPAE